MNPIVIYLVLINALGFVLMLIDKYKARKNFWRIPEANLIMVAIIGGSFGSIMGMQFFRHKTKHPKFTLGLPAILVVQIALLFLLKYYN